MSKGKSEPEVVVASVDAIDIAEGFNPRAEVVEDERFEELVASIKSTGLVTAPTVYREDGRYVLVAGERRYRAAKKAGLKELPLHVRDKDSALAAAIAENTHRVDLNPIEVARSLADLKQVEGLKTHAEIAKRVGKSTSYVSEHLRLLALPEAAQRAIASGQLPAGVEKSLKPIAKVSPEVAAAMVAVAIKDPEGPETLVENPATVLHWLVAAIEAGELNEAPTLIAMGHDPHEIGEVIVDADEAEQITERVANAALTLYGEPLTRLRLQDPEIDAARAAGCLIEVGDDWSKVRYCTDREFAADLIKRVVEQLESEAAKAAKESAKSDDDESGAEADDANATATDRMKEQKRTEREADKRRKADARAFNLKLGDRLRDRRGAKSRKAHALDRAKALALTVIADNSELGGRGLRLTAAELQEVTVTQLKSTGEDREKVSYPEGHEVQERLVKQVSDAKSVNEVLELMADALISAVVADNEELAQSRRIQWHPRASIEQTMASEIKEVSPRGRKRS